MGYIEKISDEIAAIIIKEGLDYNQTKAVFKAARQKASLKPKKKPAGAVQRLNLEEELKFIDQAYKESGRIGLMMQTLLETGCRVSEFIELRVEDISFAERIIRQLLQQIQQLQGDQVAAFASNLLRQD